MARAVVCVAVVLAVFSAAPASAAPTAPARVRSHPIARMLDGVARKAGALADRASEKMLATAERLNARGARARASTVSATGHLLKRALGTETLRHTSVSLAVGLRLNIPHLRIFNGGFFVSGWTGDLAHSVEGKSDRRFDYGLAGAAPIAKATLAAETGFGAGFSSPIVTASMDKKQWNATVGLPGVIAAGLGDWTGRAGFVRAEAGIPLTPHLGPFGLQLNLKLAVYSPALDPLVARAKPIANRIRDAGATAAQHVREAVAMPSTTAWPAIP